MISSNLGKCTSNYRVFYKDRFLDSFLYEQIMLCYIKKQISAVLLTEAFHEQAHLASSEMVSIFLDDWTTVSLIIRLKNNNPATT